MLRPRIVFRIGFAGTRRLSETSDAASRVRRTLARVFDAIGRELAECQASDCVGREPVVVRLVSGLAEGADALATYTFEAWFRTLGAGTGLTSQLMAVLPFDVDAYRSGRDDEFKPEFDALVRRCAHVLTATSAARTECASDQFAAHGSTAYRAQSQLLLGQSDLLIAVADPTAEAKCGGTIETVHAAMSGGLAVLFVDVRTGEMRQLAAGEDISKFPSRDQRDWDERARDVRATVRAIVALQRADSTAFSGNPKGKADFDQSSRDMRSGDCAAT